MPPMNMNMNMGTMNGQSFPSQNFSQNAYPPGNRTVNTNQLSEGIEEMTLELKVLATSMRPFAFGGYANRSLSNQMVLFNRLAIQDATLLSMIECFTFTYRRRGQNELNVQPNASLYYGRLRASNSPLKDRMEQVVGFRCCGCRQTTLAPNEYRVGSAQLVCVEFLSAPSTQKVVKELNAHIFQCTCIPDQMKMQLARGPPTPAQHASMADYIATWNEALLSYARATGSPKIVPSQPRHRTWQQQQQQQQTVNQGNSQGQAQRAKTTATTRPPHSITYLAATNNTNNNPSSSEFGVLQEALQAARAARKNKHYNSSLQTSPRMAHVLEVSEEEIDSEEEITEELGSSLAQGLFRNNFGIAKLRSRKIEADLTELPLSDDTSVLVSPLLELLFQSFAVVLRWKPPSAAAGGKRSNHDYFLESHVFLDCSYCKNPTKGFCATTGTPEEAATFLTCDGCNHLIEECEQAPESLKKKLVKMRAESDTKQSDNNFEVVEKNFASWKKQFETHISARDERRTFKREIHTKFWQPLTCRFMKENGGAVISDNDVSYKGGSLPFDVVDPAKKIPFAQEPDDVIFGWDGEFVGNRRFLNLVTEIRPAFLDVSLNQQKAIAFHLVKCINSRGGRFISIGPNSGEEQARQMATYEAVTRTQEVCSRGYFVLIQPPVDLTKTGRGSRVLEMEYAPQRNVFGTEVIRNKRYKMAAPEE